jgi:hypothetical protein
MSMLAALAPARGGESVVSEAFDGDNVGYLLGGFQVVPGEVD